MAGSKISNYSQLDSNILEMQLTLDQTRKGLHQISLTNYDNTSLPAIAAGSVIEVDGALYKFDSEEVIGGSPSDGTVYVKIIPSTTTCTAEFTNTAPTWSDSKQGWYGTTTSATHRYIEYNLFKSSSVWNKSRFGNQETVICSLTNSDSISMTTSGQYDAHDLALYDNKLMFNSTSKYIKPFISGYYEINTSVMARTATSGLGIQYQIRENSPSGSYILSRSVSMVGGVDAYGTISSSVVLYLDSANTYYFRIAQTGTGSTIIYLNHSTTTIKKIN